MGHDRCRNYLNHIHEAAAVLVVAKDIFTDEKAIRDAFPNLRPQQIRHLLESFQTDQLRYILCLFHCLLTCLYSVPYCRYSPDPVPKKALSVLDSLARNSDDDDDTLELDESHLLRLPKRQPKSS